MNEMEKELFRTNQALNRTLEKLADSNRDLRAVRKELDFRMAVTTAMLGTLEVEQILYIILSGITSGDGLGFNRAFLFLVDDAGRQLRVVMALGPTSMEAAEKIWESMKRDRISLSDLFPRYEAYREDDRSHDLTRQLGDFSLTMDRLEALAASQHSLFIEHDAPLVGILSRCLVNNAPCASNALTLYHEVGGPGQQLMTFRYFAMVPLSIGGRLIGAILADNYYSETRVRSDMLPLVAGLANLAALAIDRARLHAKTVAMAEVDGLTGVFNRRQYELELQRSMERCHRSGQPLSIVVFDLDYFKRTNDEHGHLVGDQVLKDVARLLVANVRKSDRVARYGGEEFVVLLENTPLRRAGTVARKLCRLVKGAPLAGGLVQGLTLSAGVAETRGQDQNPEQLFQRADRALYRAKAEGRDRVVLGTTPTSD